MPCYRIAQVIGCFAAVSTATAAERLTDFRDRNGDFVAACVKSGQIRKPKWVEREIAKGCQCIVGQMELQVAYSMRKLSNKSAVKEYTDALMAGDFIDAAIGLDKKLGDLNDVFIRLASCQSGLLE